MCKLQFRRTTEVQTMRYRWFVVVPVVSALLMGADKCGGQANDTPATHKTRVPTQLTVPEPRPHPVTKQCGIGHALRASTVNPLDDCHYPLTYTLTADARGISMTRVSWSIGLARDTFEHGEGITGHIVVVRQKPRRVPAYIEIKWTDGSVVTDLHLHYGTGCSIQVTDASGAQVGPFDSETRVHKPKEKFPYGHAACVWA
jgi:hypothetical protein